MIGSISYLPPNLSTIIVNRYRMKNIKMEKGRKSETRRKRKRDTSSSRGRQIHFEKRYFQRLAMVVCCSVLLSGLKGFSFDGSKTQMFASALLMIPTTKPRPTIRHGRMRTIFQREYGSRRRISQLSSLENDSDTETDTNSWRSNLPRDTYASPLLWETREDWVAFLKQFGSTSNEDPLWEQVKLEALTQLSTEPEAGPQLYQSILSQGSLVEAIVSIIANEVQSELVPATQIKQLFLDNLTPEDAESIRCDAIAAATRSPSVELAVLAILFHTGLHALVCYRVGHRLWKADRTGLAKYLQSTVSGRYSADIHPACSMGQGIYLCTAAGVVIGETATVGNDVSILHGVTLGGTGKELGDRHPKVQHGVILKDCATVLGNIPVGTGAVVMAKAIVNKPVPPLAIMSGVPAKVVKSRTLEREAFRDDLEEHLAFKYLDEWKELEQAEPSEA